MVLPSRKLTSIASIDTFEGSLERASAPMSVALTLADNVDVSRGDMLVHPDNVPFVEARFEANLVWMNEQELDPEASYLIKHTSVLVRAEFERVLGKTHLETLEHEPAHSLALNDIGRVIVRAHRPLFFDPYTRNRKTGAFIVIDALSNATVAAGMIVGPADDAARSARVPPRQRSHVGAREREFALGQRAAVLLLSGLPGAGKSELAYTIERLLYERGRMSLVVDPDDAASAKNPAVARQPGEVPTAVLELVERSVQVGWITLLAFASPGAEGRERVRQRAGAERYVELHVQRSPHAGPALGYQPPARPDLILDLASEPLGQAAARVIALLEGRGFIR